jgi:hypothetical protein
MLNILRRHGLWPFFYALALRILHALAGFKVLKAICAASPDPAFLQCPAGYTALFLPADMLRRFDEDPRCEMSAAFVEQALARGDECFALLDGDTLAAYGWYSFRPTPIGLPEMLLHFSADYVYMYKGFTHPRYRGQRLHAIGMSMALRHYLARGYKGLVSYVESTNFDSLRSCQRMGYRVFGSVYLARLFGRHFSLSSPGCELFRFGVRSATSGSPSIWSKSQS